MSAGQIQPLLQRLGGVYNDPLRVSRDATQLLNHVEGSALIPSVSSFMEEENLYHPKVLAFNGTVSMTYRGGKYYIPVEIFLPPGYPLRPPICYVRPLANMTLKLNHRHVGQDGMMYMPYLHNWRNYSSNLVDMVLAMSQIFSAEPPCYAKSPNPVVPGEEERARNARSQLRKKIHDYLNAYYNVAREEIRTGLMEQSKLKSGQKTIDEQKRSLSESKVMIQSQISQLNQQLSVMSEAIERAKEKKEPDVDELAIPTDVCSRQILDLIVTDASLTDCLHFIDKGLHKGKLPPNDHLKQVRKLAKQQFMVRAHLMKIIRLNNHV